MKRLLCIAGLACTTLASTAHAQAYNFQGLGLSLGLSSVRTHSELVRLGVRSSDTGGNANFSLQARYNLVLGEQFVLGLGASTTVGEATAGTLTASGTALPIKVNEAYSVFVAPSYALSGEWLIYGKLALLDARATATGGGSTHFDSGTGLGLGLQTLVHKHWYMQAEYMANQYDNRTFGVETNKLDSSILSFGMGYQF